MKNENAAHSQPGIILVVCGAFLFAAIANTLLKSLKLPYTLVTALYGMVIGALSLEYAEVYKYTKEIDNISPKLLMHIFMPVLMFSSAFETEYRSFWKSIIQPSLMSVPGFLLTNTLIASLVYTYTGDWFIGMMFGAIIGTFDPSIATTLLRSLDTAKPLIPLIERESLFNHGIAIISFEAFKDLATDYENFNATSFTLKLVLKALVSPFLGLIVAKVITFCLPFLNGGSREISISLAMTYITFFSAESLGLSGVIAVIIMGLLLNPENFSPEMKTSLQCFWNTLTHLANTLIFLFIGVLLARAFVNLALSDFIKIIVFYFAVYIIRLVVVVIASPLLGHIIHGFSWRWAAACVLSGTKGAFVLCLTLMAYRTEGLDEMNIRHQILLLSSGTVLLSLLINATTMTSLLKLLGLCNISMHNHMAKRMALQKLQKNAENSIRGLKNDRFLNDTKWDRVANWVNILDVFNGEKVEELSRPEMNGVMEEARMNILNAQKKNYWKQYRSGMLTGEAARTLVNTAENLWDQEGRLMSVLDIKMYWLSDGFFATLRRKLENCIYDVKGHKLEPSRNALLKICYRVAFSLPFEFFSYVLILANIIPIVLEFIPETGALYQHQLRIVNNVFFIFYVTEAVLKALAMRKAYIFNHWNQFDLCILLMAAVDIIIDNFLKMKAVNLDILKMIRIFKILRFTRLLRFIKIIIPKLIKLIDRQIQKQLSFGYGIMKGYIIAQEDSSKILGHVSKSKTLKEELETNRKQAARELCILGRRHPEITSSVLTRQAIQAFLISQKDAIQTLMSDSLEDENMERSKLEKLIERKMKGLTKFPLTVPPPTAEELLENIPWLNRDQLQFIKGTAKLNLWHIGDVITKENEDAHGIHLIISGMVKITGRRLNLGGKEPKDKKQVTDYWTSGTIIGELNCLTRQPMEITATCETVTQTYFIPLETLFEAFGLFPEHPSLEYKIWHSLVVRLYKNKFMEDNSHQSWTPHNISAYLEKAHLVEVGMHQQFDVNNGSIEDLILVYGSCRDSQTHHSYNAPARVCRTTEQILGTAERNTLLVVPSVSAEEDPDSAL